MSSMAFICSAYIWLWHKMLANKSAKESFTASIWRGQVFIFLFVMMVSIFMGAYNFYLFDSHINIKGELLILSTALVFSYTLAKKQGSKHLILKHVGKILLFGFTCILGWFISFVLGWVIGIGVYHLLYSNHNAIAFDFGFLPVLIIGIMWNIPIIMMFLKISDNYKLSGLGLHKFLWPVMLAYLILLVPLMIQKVANSKTWHDIKNAKIIRQA